MKLSDWARKQGITYKAAWKIFKSGKLPVPAYQLPTGTIIVEEPRAPVGEAIIYARVSSHDQKPTLDAQVARCLAFANAKGLSRARTVTEVGSGLNGQRSGLLKILADPKVTAIVVEHRDRLMRFGCEYVQAALSAHGCSLVVVDDTELNDDLVQDMIAVLTSFCARL
jgi:Predicted site-specific integrase-resolvase